MKKMRNVVLFEDFNNKTLNPEKFPKVLFPIIEEILLKSESFLDETVSNIEKNTEEKFNRKLSSYDIKMLYYNLVYDLVNSLSKNLNYTDVLKKLDTNISKGSLVINAIIERDGVEYRYVTEGVYAGGYNIQTLHIRYITKTNLPKSDNNDIVKDIKNQINKLSNIEKINKEILYYQNVITRYNIELEELKKITEDDILNNNYAYQTLKKEGWKANSYDEFSSDYMKNQESFDEYLNELRINIIKNHKNNIKNKEKSIKECEKKIEKLLKNLS